MPSRQRTLPPERNCRVLSSRRLNHEAVLLELLSPEIVAEAVPGQFVMLTTPAGFLRRPLAICRVDRDRQSFFVGMQAKGPGIAALMEAEHGDEISTIGPLGRPFDLQGYARVIAVGGGTGVYPLLMLLEQAASRRMVTDCVLGFRQRSNLVLEDAFRAVAPDLLLASEAGDLDVHGTVLDALERLLDGPGEAEAAEVEEGPTVRHAQRRAGEGRTLIACCGPDAMMRAVAGLARERGFDCQVSLEARMACGYGVCRTCACRVRHAEQPQGWTYDRVCHEGPVFAAEAIIWEGETP